MQKQRGADQPDPWRRELKTHFVVLSVLVINIGANTLTTHFRSRFKFIVVCIGEKSS